MGWRVRKRVKIAKGLYINLGKKGASVSVGVPGATVNLSKRGTTTTVGIPGTGLSHTSTSRRRVAAKSAARQVPAPQKSDREKMAHNFNISLIAVVAGFVFVAVPGVRPLGVLILFVALPLAAIFGIPLWHFAKQRAAAAFAESTRARNTVSDRPSPVFDSRSSDELGALEQRRVFPKSTTKAVQLPDEDNWETGHIAGRADEVPLHAALFIRYCDARGQASSRNITLRSIVPWEGNDIAMLAYCHERQAHRTFLASRVIEAVQIETGEIIGNVDHWLRLNFTNTPQGRIAGALKLVEAECLILAYIARADGAMRAKERACIAEFISEAGYELGIDAADEVELDKRVRTIYCDYDEFRKAIDKVRDGPENRRRAVVRVAREIVATEKRVDPAEQKAVDTLAEMLA